jgi:kynureninase
MNTQAQNTATNLDTNDPLAKYRGLFEIRGPELIYLDGNSLGRMPKAAAQLGQDLINNQWADRLIRGWGEGWLEMPRRIGDKIATLIGANPGEVMLADSTSINLYKLATAGLQYQKGRKKIITDDMNFPSDVYILGGVIGSLGNRHTLEIVHSEDEIHGPEDAILSALDEDTALLTLSLTTFKSGFTYDLGRMTQAAREAGALVLWDLSHSAGVIPMDLAANNADLAVGCTYKYLNGGPGAPAYLYVREDLQEKLNNPIPGWMGQRNMFNFDLEYQPVGDLSRMLTGTPTILSGSLIEPGVDILIDAGIYEIRKKSILLTNLFIELSQEVLLPLGFSVNSPLDEERRGSHVSLGHEEGIRIDKALINDYKIIPDFRAPDNIRFGFAPVYTTFSEVYQAVFALKEIVESKVYKKYSQDKPMVT